MRVRSLALQTELALAALRGKVIDRGDYIVVETPDDPSFRYGNLLVLPAPPQVGEVAYWTRRFGDELGKRAGIEHVCFSWDGIAGDAGATAELASAGFELERLIVMTAMPRAIAAAPAPLPIRALAADDALATARLAYTIGETHDEVTREFLERRAANHRDLVRRGVAKFFGAFDGDNLVASLGIVQLGKLARYRDVQTLAAYRSRGLASALLASAAAAVDPSSQLLIVTLEGSAAARLYERVGFRVIERTVSACKRPT